MIRPLETEFEKEDEPGPASSEKEATPETQKEKKVSGKKFFSK